jgi:tRNA G18 (ribose-2'-O)-methylase SpoU
MTPSSNALPLADVAGLVRGLRTVVVVGHEGDGLTPDSIAASSYQARIPIASGVDSVNVATAVAIALYELTRG